MSAAAQLAAAPAAAPATASAPDQAAPIRLCLQVNTHGADRPVWRDVIIFPRSDEVACAHVITAAPLLAAAAGPGAVLRILSMGFPQRVLSTWDGTNGWQGWLYGGCLMGVA